MWRAGVVLALLALVPVVTGCGGDALALDPVAEAAAKTRDISSARFVMVLKARDQDGPLTMRGPGEIDDHGRLMHMRVTMPRRQVGLRGGGNVEFEMILAGKSYYYRGGPFADLTVGKKWVRVRDDQAPPDLGQNDPGAMLDYLRATSDVTEVGDGSVRGVPTTHYRARIQLDRAAELAPPEAKRRVEQAVTRLQSLGVEEIPLEAWVDGEGLVRRITMNWHPQAGSIVMTLELFDFGQEIGLKIPPASQTIPIDMREDQ